MKSRRVDPRKPGRLAHAGAVSGATSPRRKAQLRLTVCEELLRLSRQRQRDILDNLPDIAFLKDKQGRYLVVNKAWCRFSGVRARDAIGKTVFDIFPPLTARELYQEDRRVILSGKQARYQRVFEEKDNRIWHETIKTPVFDKGGKVTGLAAIAHDITDHKKAQDALRAAHSQLEVAREQERRRLARELHDSVGQKIVAAGLKLKTLGREIAARHTGQVRASLADLDRQFHDVSAEIRRVSRTLYPQVLDAMGLPAALRQLKSDLESRHVRVWVNYARTVENARLGDNVEIALYRIVQEAVSNALRHANCTQVHLALGRSGGQLRLTIVDDGVGFVPERKAGKGLGLTSMRERADSIGATLMIRSRPGRTSVEVRLPGATKTSRKNRTGRSSRSNHDLLENT